MLKKYTTLIGTLLIGLAFGFAHISSPTIAELPSYHSYDQHSNSGDCKTSCQGVLKGRKGKIDHNTEKDDDSPETTWPSNVPLAATGVGLLKPDALLTQSSWRPPDIVLLTGQYSSSL